MTIAFRVDGQAIPQGSMRAFARNGHAVVTHANPQNLGAWRQAIAARADEAMDAAGMTMLAGPVGIELVFGLRRPRQQYGVHGVTPKYIGAWPITAPDADKLLRAVLDALTGVAFVDDAQVVEIHVRKEYRDRPGVDITIRHHGSAIRPASVAPSLGLLEEQA